MQQLAEREAVDRVWSAAARAGHPQLAAALREMAERMTAELDAEDGEES